MQGTIIEMVSGSSGTCGSTSYMIDTGDIIPFMAIDINKKTFPNNSPSIGDKVYFRAVGVNHAVEVRYIHV